MKESLREGYSALFDGNRAAIEKLFPMESDEPPVIWLKANAAEDTKERLRLLELILTHPYSEYQNMAAAILERENHYAHELSLPPSYKFWVKRRVEVVEE